MTTTAKLPDLCAAILQPEGVPIYIVREQPGYFFATSNLDVDAFNQAIGVTPPQRVAMIAGSLFGWHAPSADPDRYDDAGKIIMPRRASRRVSK